MFTWKRNKDIFKGEGIYHLTFVVRDRLPILGQLVMDAQAPRVKLTELGYQISSTIRNIPNHYPGTTAIAKLLMPDHIHVVIYIKEYRGYSIKEISRGLRQAWKKLAAELAVSGSAVVDINRQIVSAEPYRQKQQTGAQPQQGTGASPLFSAPFIRTLSRKGQLDAMVRYIHDNPRRAMLRRQHPDLFKIRREVNVQATLRNGTGTASNEETITLRFSALGNLFLLDYPVRQAVICSRSTTEEAISRQGDAILTAAEQGAVTYSGAISAGERQITRAVREEGFPLVVVLKDGFPAEGTEQERYFKPGGVYFEACAAGRLLLLEPTEATLKEPHLQALTEQALREKAEAKHQEYHAIPHTSDRWRMMANNTIVNILTNIDL